MAVVEFTDALSSEVIADAVSWRRHLHQHPELAFNERQTSDFIATQLASFGLKVHRGLAGTGVVGTLTRGSSRRAIGIRADMDALPIQEQSGVAHVSSTSGVMHACGHDGHIAVALAAARACAKMPDLDGTVHFIFQPAEEGAGGAKRMIEDGLFKLFPCDAIYGMHNQPLLPLGSCIARDGVMMAACALFDIDIVGRGCHGGRPHQGVDPVVAGCQLVSSLQSIISRNVDPLQSGVVSVTKIRAGDSFNVIPERFQISGTVRWLDGDIGDIIEQRMRELASSIAAGFRCEAHVSYDRRFCATVNDPAAARLVREIASGIPNLRVENFLPSTGSEDFSEMLRVVPGCFIWLGGAKTGSEVGLHSPRYDFNDDLVPLGAALWVSLVRKSLSAA
jgi:amidohydrolase